MEVSRLAMANMVLKIVKPDKAYLCDPTKNIECKRSVGGECCSEHCAATTNPEYAKLDEYGRPIKVFDIRRSAI